MEERTDGLDLGVDEDLEVVDGGEDVHDGALGLLFDGLGLGGGESQGGAQRNGSSEDGRELHFKWR